MLLFWMKTWPGFKGMLMTDQLDWESCCLWLGNVYKWCQFLVKNKQIAEWLRSLLSMISNYSLVKWQVQLIGGGGGCQNETHYSQLYANLLVMDPRFNAAGYIKTRMKWKARQSRWKIWNFFGYMWTRGGSIFFRHPHPFSYALPQCDG